MATKRFKEHLTIQNRLLWEVKKFYPEEFSIGMHALDLIKTTRYSITGRRSSEYCFSSSKCAADRRQFESNRDDDQYGQRYSKHH